jgi:hypothetical protein
MLCGIIAVDVAQSDAVTRAIEIGGLLLGAPFALWRGRAAVSRCALGARV